MENITLPVYIMVFVHYGRAVVLEWEVLGISSNEEIYFGFYYFFNCFMILRVKYDVLIQFHSFYNLILILKDQNSIFQLILEKSICESNLRRLKNL